MRTLPGYLSNLRVVPLQEADTGIFPIPTWGNFEQQFWVHFFPVNAEADTINALESTSLPPRRPDSR